MEEVLVIIKGKRDDIQDAESVEIMTMGKMYYRNDKTYILYDEDAESHTTHNTIKIDKETMSVKRRGDIETDLYFEKDFPFISQYQTPYGMMEMKVKTQQIAIKETDESVSVEVVYQLEMNNMDLGVNTYSLLAKKRRNHQFKIPYESVEEDVQTTESKFFKDKFIE